MPKNHFDLSGKIAVITGGSRGLGREMVLAFADAGADVVITSRKIDSCEALAKEVEETTGRTALPIACHVGYWGAVRRADRDGLQSFRSGRYPSQQCRFVAALSIDRRDQ